MSVFAFAASDYVLPILAPCRCCLNAGQGVETILVSRMQLPSLNIHRVRESLSNWQSRNKDIMIMVKRSCTQGNLVLVIWVSAIQAIKRVQPWCFIGTHVTKPMSYLDNLTISLFVSDVCTYLACQKNTIQIVSSISGGCEIQLRNFPLILMLSVVFLWDRKLKLWNPSSSCYFLNQFYLLYHIWYKETTYLQELYRTGWGPKSVRPTGSNTPIVIL